MFVSNPRHLFNPRRAGALFFAFLGCRAAKEVAEWNARRVPGGNKASLLAAACAFFFDGFVFLHFRVICAVVLLEIFVAEGPLRGAEVHGLVSTLGSSIVT